MDRSPTSGGPSADVGRFKVPVRVGHKATVPRPPHPRPAPSRPHSPERGWTSLAPPSAFGSRRAWVGGSLGEHGGLFRYRDDGMSVLWVRELAEGVELEAQSRLAAPVYSHQNLWAGVFVAAPRRLQLGFSPAGNAPLDVLPSEYPIGKPIRL
ncbi:MAG TPA: hypothetical protein DCE44_19250, partial [Verrucomicrobiales bacterium]|nr:hypothetical protein [Verrucomicrobiales bacterium]